MFSPSHDTSGRRTGAPLLRLVSAFSLLAVLAAWADDGQPVLRIAADPNNLPFSNERGEGFENKLVDLIARELGARTEYTWWAQRRGFFRNTLREGTCDLVAGVPHRFDPVLTSTPYYRSMYVVVTRADRHLQIRSLDDPALRSLTIGVQMVGDDFANTPPAHALARRGIVSNVRGYTLYGDYREPNPPARIIGAVEKGEVDLAIVWGPLAGYFAKSAATPLTLMPLPEKDSASDLAFAFSISIGVRRSNQPLRDKINAILARKKPEIEALLDAYGVPRVQSTP
jgi:quinoprotein dehydrogenase-associated probable ABC transporter substrate-binding protein